MIVGQSLRRLGAGIALGLLLSIAATRVLGAFLYDISPTDATLAAVTLALAGVALGAAWLPARRAARLDPDGGAAVGVKRPEATSSLRPIRSSSRKTSCTPPAYDPNMGVVCFDWSWLRC